MKSDALTAAAAVFLIGLLASGLGLLDIFDSEPEAPTELHRGVNVSQFNFGATRNSASVNQR